MGVLRSAGGGVYATTGAGWLALEQVLGRAGLISESAVIERSVQFGARPAGHDHRHDDHDHTH